MALKEALSSVYWYKSDLRGFLQAVLANPSLLSQFDWNGYKRQVAADIVDYLISRPEQYLGDVTKLCYELCNFRDYSHLQTLDDGAQKAAKARQAVERLRQLVEPHQDAKKAATFVAASKLRQTN